MADKLAPIDIDPNIARASTLPAAVYSDPAYYRLQKDAVFARSWQWVGDADRVKAPGHVLPFTLLEGCLDEPLVLASDESATLRCLSNVCTHRGTLVVEEKDIFVRCAADTMVVASRWTAHLSRCPNSTAPSIFRVRPMICRS